MLTRQCIRACRPTPSHLLRGTGCARFTSNEASSATPTTAQDNEPSHGSSSEQLVVTIPKEHMRQRKSRKQRLPQPDEEQTRAVMSSLRAIRDRIEQNRKVIGSLEPDQSPEPAPKVEDPPPEPTPTRTKKSRKGKKAAATNDDDSDEKTGATEEMVGEYEEQGWGTDALAPPPETPQLSRSEKKRQKREKRETPILYSRRVEGLIESSMLSVLQGLDPVSEHRPIATLKHGLERVLFNPGVHWLRDPRSRVYNFPPRLEDIPKVFDFAFERLEGFVTSSRDEDLWSLAEREGRIFGGSTSSLTGILSQIYFLLSDDKPPDVSTLSSYFARENPGGFTPGQRMAASVIYNYRNGVYAIDSDPGAKPVEKNILTWMGTMLEKYLTMSEEEFTTYLRTTPVEDLLTEDGSMREAYRYAKSDKFVMRAQLDCHDPRLPGTGVFDIKTRACLPIRMDLLNFEENSGYLIRSLHGALESFEREYYDLIRSAFLKYSFQVRIGNMDGVLVAYHNTAKLFGFQYIPLEQMEQHLYGVARPDAGESPTARGDKVFSRAMRLLELLSEEIVSAFPGQSVRCTFEKQEFRDTLNVWVQPTEWSGAEEDWPIKQISLSLRHFVDNKECLGRDAVERPNKNWIVQWRLSHLTLSNHDARLRLDAAKKRQFRAWSLPNGVTYDTIEAWWHSLDFGSPRPESASALGAEAEDTAEEDVDSLSAAVSSRTHAEALAEIEADASTSGVITDSSETSERFEGAEGATDGEPAPTPTPANDAFLRNFHKPDPRVRLFRRLARQGRVHSEEMAQREREAGRSKVVLDRPGHWAEEGKGGASDATSRADVQEIREKLYAIVDQIKRQLEKDASESEASGEKAEMEVGEKAEVGETLEAGEEAESKVELPDAGKKAEVGNGQVLQEDATAASSNEETPKEI